MNLQIRLAKSFDIERLIELQSNSIRSLSTDYELREIESLVISQARARLTYNEIVFLAFYKDELVGFACLIVNSSRLSGLYVHPNFIRQGIGTHLLDFINKTAREKGCKVIDVYSSVTAVNFYQSRGFQVIRSSGFFTEDNIWIPCTYMKKNLVLHSNLAQINHPIIGFISRIKPKPISDIQLIILFLISSLLPLIIILIKN
jgi:putative acetyltransferase